MSTGSIPTSPADGDDNQTSGGSRKTASVRPTEPPLKCPRCDSPNTKFCYYNNYSLTQPRHFCKTCRRYWTKGGALRNVPIGGGCRKNKRTKSAARLSCSDSKDSATSSHSGGFKFFQGLSPAMDFQLGGGGGGGLPFSRLQSSRTISVHNTNNNHHFVSFGGELSSAAATATNPSCFDIDDAAAATATSGSPMGFNLSSYPIGIGGGGGGFKSDGGIREMGSINVNSSLASSIESLSCINQDLHWKLQQQRLAMLLGGETHKDGEGVSALPVTAVSEIQTQKPQPISFQNLGISKQEVSAGSNPMNTKSGISGATTTEWFFENSYTPTSTTTTNNNNSASNENDNTSNWNGIQAWMDLHRYSALP